MLLLLFPPYVESKKKKNLYHGILIKLLKIMWLNTMPGMESWPCNSIEIKKNCLTVLCFYLCKMSVHRHAYIW